MQGCIGFFVFKNAVRTIYAEQQALHVNSALALSIRLLIVLSFTLINVRCYLLVFKKINLPLHSFFGGVVR